jgi:hypothetical protein
LIEEEVEELEEEEVCVVSGGGALLSFASRLAPTNKGGTKKYF